VTASVQSAKICGKYTQKQAFVEVSSTVYSIVARALRKMYKVYMASKHGVYSSC